MTRAKSYRTEADVKAAVKVILKELGFFYWMPGANGFGTQGVSDFLALKDGVFFAIETKVGNNKPTALQMAYLEKVNAHGGRAFWINEHQLYDLKDTLVGILNSVKVSRLLRDS